MIDLEEYIADYNIKYKKMYLRDRFRYYLYLPWEDLQRIYIDYLEDFGFGSNLIELSDSHRAHVSLGHLGNLLDYSYFQWEFLSKIEGFEQGDFTFTLRGEWFTWLEGEEVIFGEVHSLDSYLEALFHEVAHDYMRECIPHTITYGKWNRSRTQVEEILTYIAGGREEELINWRIEFSYFMKMEFSQFIDPFLTLEGTFYTRKWADECVLVVAGEHTAKSINFESFVEDFRTLSIDTSDYVEEIKVIFREKLDELKKIGGTDCEQ